MIIKTLVENTSVSEDYDHEHGLSLYIETRKHKLLFDLGATGLFADNANKMGVDLTSVDLVVISHGHNDHGGGLTTFSNINSKAEIYLHEKAFGKYFSRKPTGEIRYIGFNEKLIPNHRFVFSGKRTVIDSELELFANVKGTKLNPSGNKNLMMKKGDSLEPDDFVHEQNLVIKENGKIYLFAGCAHNGIVNIIDHYNEMNNSWPNYVMGGFHLYSRSADKSEEPYIVRQVGKYLLNTGSMYFTCHCTGLEAYGILKDIMGEKLEYLATGSRLTL